MILDKEKDLVEDLDETKVQQEQEESASEETEKETEISASTEVKEKDEEDKKGRFQKRIDTLVRRAGEAERERDEAVAYARKVIAERDRERAEKIALSEQSATTSLGEADAKIELYKKQFKEAFEIGDSEKAMEAQSKLAELHVERSKAKTWADRITKEKQSKPVIQDEDGEESSQAVSRRPSMDVSKPSKLALKWHERNPWYGEDAEASAAALVANRRLVAEGYDPETQDFYDELDSRIKRFIPRREKEDETETRNVRPTTVAAGSKRTASTAEPRLTDAQKRLINRLGVSEKEYKEQMRKLEEQ